MCSSTYTGATVQAWKALISFFHRKKGKLTWNLLSWSPWQGWNSFSSLGYEDILQVLFTYNTKTGMMKKLLAMGRREWCHGLHPIPAHGQKSSSMKIFRNRLDFSQNDYNVLLGGPPPRPNPTANFFIKSNQSFHHARKPQAEVEPFLQTHLLPQTYNNLLTRTHTHKMLFFY